MSTCGRRRILHYCNLGRLKYEKALEIQEEQVRRQLRALETVIPRESPTAVLPINAYVPRMNADDSSTSPDILFVVEHEPVYTAGLRKNEFTEVDEDFLKAKGADFHRTNRGGLITFHGPGQLVAYPILNLQRYKPSVRWYVHQLEELLIKTCQEFHVESARTENTGIWVEDTRKIAAIGLNCKKHITSHGVALNCDTDLSWFDHIVPCGLRGLGVTSLTKERIKYTPIDEVMPVFLEKFAEIFNVILKEIPVDQINELSNDTSVQKRVKEVHQ